MSKKLRKEAVMHGAYGHCLCVRVRHLILDMTFHLLRNYAKMSFYKEEVVRGRRVKKRIFVEK